MQESDVGHGGGVSDSVSEGGVVSSKTAGGVCSGGSSGSGKALAKTTCWICKKTTNKIASNKFGGIQCFICDRWYHPPCVHLNSKKFEMIAQWEEDGSRFPWKCPPCDSSQSKLFKAVTVLNSRLDETERRMGAQDVRLERVEDKGKFQDSRLDIHDKDIKELRDQLAQLGDNGSSSAFREMNERYSKETNLVIHSVPESDSSDNKTRLEHDKRSLMELLVTMDVELIMDNDVKFVRRLGDRENDKNGQIRNKSVPRPILVGLKFKYHHERILDSTWKLSESENDSVRCVSVVKDLTTRQRAGEMDLIKETAKKNIERSEEDVDRNMVFKVVGRRGEKREIKVPLREGEVVNQDGLVLWEENLSKAGGFLSGRKRVTGKKKFGQVMKSGGNSQPLGNRVTPSKVKGGNLIVVKEVKGGSSQDNVKGDVQQDIQTGIVRSDQQMSQQILPLEKQMNQLSKESVPQVESQTGWSQVKRGTTRTSQNLSPPPLMPAGKKNNQIISPNKFQVLGEMERGMEVENKLLGEDN